MPRIGLLGGTFNPFHLGHLRIVLTALEQLSLDEVQLIPSGQPWQKAPLSIEPSHRLTMLKLATKGMEKVRINTMELERQGPSYTIDTLRQLPNTSHYYWLMGSDQLNNFCTWHQWEAILQYVRLVIVKRPNHEINPPIALKEALGSDHSLLFLTMDELDISSTQLRQLLQQGEATDDFIHPDVLQYIKDNHLYGY